MAAVNSFGDMTFRTITPDELALTVRESILYGLQTDELRARGIRQRTRGYLPLLGPEQLSVVLTAFSTVALNPEWETLRTLISNS